MGCGVRRRHAAGEPDFRTPQPHVHDRRVPSRLDDDGLRALRGRHRAQCGARVVSGLDRCSGRIALSATGSRAARGNRDRTRRATRLERAARRYCKPCSCPPSCSQSTRCGCARSMASRAAVPERVRVARAGGGRSECADRAIAAAATRVAACNLVAAAGRRDDRRPQAALDAGAFGLATWVAPLAGTAFAALWTDVLRNPRARSPAVAQSFRVRAGLPRREIGAQPKGLDLRVRHAFRRASVLPDLYFMVFQPLRAERGRGIVSGVVR